MYKVGVYKLTAPNGKVYIGQSRNLGKRLKYYSYDSAASSRRQPRLYNSLRKYGYASFTIDVLITFEEDIDQSALDFCETLWIRIFDSTGKEGLNCRPGGRDNQGQTSDETKAKLSLAMKGKKRSPQTEAHKQAISRSLKGTKFEDRVRAEKRAEMSASQSERQQGRKLSAETRAKISASQKGHPVSQETRDKIARANTKS